MVLVADIFASAMSKELKDLQAFGDNVAGTAAPLLRAEEVVADEELEVVGEGEGDGGVEVGGGEVE